MFIDDTGDVEDPATNDPKRRYASITGVVFEWEYYHTRFDKEFQELKTHHFGLTRKERPPILRRHNLVHAEGPFQGLSDDQKRAQWDSDILELYENAEYTVITVAVDKVAFYYKYPNWREDVYEFLIQLAIERFYFFLRNRDSTGDVMVEEMGKQKNSAIKTRYRKLLESGFQQHSAGALQTYLSSLEIKIKPKGDNYAGLQMADLLAAIAFHDCHQRYDNGRGLRGMSARVADIIQRKYYCEGKNSPTGYGCIWRPKPE